MHVFDFANDAALLFATILPFCSPQAAADDAATTAAADGIDSPNTVGVCGIPIMGCEAMTAGRRVEYLWADPSPSTISTSVADHPTRPPERVCCYSVSLFCELAEHPTQIGFILILNFLIATCS
jgi:hypothetical protein